MPLDFPADPDDGDLYEDFYWSESAGIWRRQLSTVENIDDLDNVDAVDPADGDILVYSSSSDTWVAQEDATIGLILALGG
jgi:hypothetical protein